MTTQSAQPLSQTSLRKLAVGSTVALVSAPYVRFRRAEDKSWVEVPREGIKPRTVITSELFLLGVREV